MDVRTWASNQKISLPYSCGILQLRRHRMLLSNHGEPLDICTLWNTCKAPERGALSEKLEAVEYDAIDIGFMGLVLFTSVPD